MHAYKSQNGKCTNLHSISHQKPTAYIVVCVRVSMNLLREFDYCLERKTRELLGAVPAIRFHKMNKQLYIIVKQSDSLYREYTLWKSCYSDYVPPVVVVRKLSRQQGHRIARELRRRLHTKSLARNMSYLTRGR